MEKHFAKGCLLFAMLVSPGTVLAAEPYYFHKPTIDRATFESDIGACAELAGGVKVNSASPYSPNIYANAAGAFFSGMMASRTRRALVDSIVRTCMVDKGYNRYEMTADQRREIGDLDGAARMARLHELAAAAEPTGEALAQ
jgi:hypothetical protein